MEKGLHHKIGFTGPTVHPETVKQKLKRKNENDGPVKIFNYYFYNILTIRCVGGPLPVDIRNKINIIFFFIFFGNKP